MRGTSIGTCTQKSSTLFQKAFFVAPQKSLEYNDKGRESRSNTLSTPADDLMEAFSQLEDATAPFTSSKVTVYLLKGTHYLWNVPKYSYRQVNSDPSLEGVEVTLK